MKTCTKCGGIKPIIEFNAKKSSKDGVSSHCKVCTKKVQYFYRAINVERIKVYQLEYRKKNIDKIKKRKIADRIKRPEKIKKGLADWYLKNKEKVSTDAKKKYAENSEAIKKRVDEYRLLNPDKIKKGQAKHREKNKEKAKIYSVAWRAKNHDISKIHRQNRRAKIKLATGSISRGLKNKLFKLQHGKCACCGFGLGGDYHMDHIVPLARGGTNTDDNIQLLTAKCNMQKSAKDPIEFMQFRGFLL